MEHLPTHSVSGIEGVVASNKVVSARENIRSAHVETLKREVQDEGRKERRALRGQETRSHERVFWSI